MKPTLIEQPYGSYLSNILKTFESGKPLSPDQLNFLASHEKILSSYAFDPVIKYYLKGYHDKAKNELIFSLSNRQLTQLSAEHIKQYIQGLLNKNLTHVDLKMTLSQFQHFKAIGINELIFWHGNQFLTNAPFYPGGIPYVIYVQWGNLFGVVNLRFSFDEKALKGKVNIYLEDMKARTLYQCVKDYSHRMRIELSQQKNIIETDREEEILAQRPSPTLKPYFYEIR